MSAPVADAGVVGRWQGHPRQLLLQHGNQCVPLLPPLRQQHHLQIVMAEGLP